MIFVGTVHVDIDGSKRLRHLLEAYRPRCITVEYPADESIADIERKIREQQERGVRLMKRIRAPENMRGVYTEIAAQAGYDTLVPILYAKENGLEVYPVDHPGIRKGLQLADDEGVIEMFSINPEDMPPNVDKPPYETFREVFGRNMDSCYDTLPEINDSDIRSSPENIAWLDHLNNPAFEETREQYMADAIRKRHSYFHVGGLAHMKDDSELISVVPLHRRLDDIITARIRLCDAFSH